jgi:hypothetical protein
MSSNPMNQNLCHSKGNYQPEVNAKLSDEKNPTSLQFTVKESHTLSQKIALNIPIIILASPDITSITFESICNHIINQSMFIPVT